MKNFNFKVSVLVPVYNVSNYIERCAKSLFDQTFSDIEYVFVNDATSDDSIDILKTVIDKYPASLKERVFIFNHAENRGLAATRITALENCRGQYVLNVDSDDYIELDMIEKMYNKAVEENADIVVSDIFIENIQGSHIFTDYLSNDSDMHFFDMLKNERSSPSLCNKLIKTTLYKREECRVPIGLNYLEDRFVSIRLYYYANKIVKVNQPFYHYVQYNPTSITRNKTKMHFENVVLFWDLLDKFLSENDLYEQCHKELELVKVREKASLLIETDLSHLRKEFRLMFYNEETNTIKHFKRGEKLMLLLVRYKMFGLAQLFHKLLVLKNRKRKHNGA